MKCIIVTVLILAVAGLSYGTGQQLKCKACISIQTQPNLIDLSCNISNLPEVTCWKNMTACGRATINGAGIVDPNLPAPVAFNATILGCVQKIKNNSTCSEDNDARSDLLGNILNYRDDYGISDTAAPFIESLPRIFQADTTILYANTVCPLNGTIVGGAGSLRTDVVVVVAALVMAIFAKEF
ncbi:uncharacterized protein LOC121420060 [Lytechinus variegatus]|uniref:uncharacterized protein LOC121420060 n=1 Tax=Lytechinus variegatus TaxID=7654 RepID=UPI001BB0F123|nr:uncharacterized protein LOC121420060 [Lytechinus variegatus]